MGEITWHPGNRVYLDTNLFIYAIEEIVPHDGYLMEVQSESTHDGKITAFIGEKTQSSHVCSL